MKRLIITAAIMLALGMAAQAQEAKRVVVVKQGKTFTATKNETSKGSSYSPTGFTYEYNLKTGRVIQCRAACNAEPKRYNDIVSLVKRSMELKTIKYAA